MTLAAMLLWLCLSSAQASASDVYTQPPTGNGALLQSSWWAPDDSDYDIFIWDDFVLAAPHAITEITWRGGFLYGGTWSGPVQNFTVAIYPSIAAGTEPDVTHAPLVEYETGDNAGQTYAGVFGGTAMYDYHFTLPAPFQAAAGTRYWVQIYAWHGGIPEWGFATGSGGNGHYFRFVRGLHMYQAPPGDAAFTLFASDSATFTITTGVAPAGAGAVQGGGSYPVGSQAALLALPNASWGFWRWTENGTPVSTANPYVFTVTADRTLIANFMPTYSITTASLPTYGGTTSGGGVFDSGATVVVAAAPAAHFGFVRWSEFGTTVSTSPTYMFTAAANRALVAEFVADGDTRVFDINDAPVHTSLPVDLTAGGLGAHLTGAYSIQFADVFGFLPQGFDGLCVCPNSVFLADLTVDFSAPLTSFSILYSPQELGCDDSATLRATGYLDGVFAATHTVTAPQPGTWPTGQLTLDAQGSFNRVVVHYDAKPPTCQDWGPIFLADNMIATLAAPPCFGDVNNDGLVDQSDLAGLLANYGLPGGATLADGDVDGDGDVDQADLAGVLSVYNSACP